jgi:hypothetical protein
MLLLDFGPRCDVKRNVRIRKERNRKEKGEQSLSEETIYEKNSELGEYTI